MSLLESTVGMSHIYEQYLHCRLCHLKNSEVDVLLFSSMMKAPPLHPFNYQNWRGPLSAKLSKTCQAFDSKKYSLRKAAELYGIPKSTSHDHATGKVLESSVSGPERYLSAYEEVELCNFL